jgi:hypothetical protein
MTWLWVTLGVLTALGLLVFVIARLSKRDGRQGEQLKQTAATAEILERQRDAQANAPDPDNPRDIIDRL